MKIFLILLLVYGCSHHAPDGELSPSAQGTPEWVFAPYEECTEARELCATGEAASFAEASAQARANLASIFEVQVKSNLNVNTQASQSFPWMAKVHQQVEQNLQQTVNQVLEVVQIKKHFKKDGLTYALASLDREDAGDLLEKRLSKLDQEIEQLWKNRQRTGLRRLVKLNLEREKINERYSIIAGHPLPPVVHYEEILRWKNSRPQSQPLQLRVGQAPEWMIEKLKELLTEAGFKLVKSGAAQILSLNVDSIKEYLNVEGFEKYTFTAHLTNIEGGEKKKVISTSETVTGRSQGDALLKVKKYFVNYLEENLSDLQLD